MAMMIHRSLFNTNLTESGMDTTPRHCTNVAGGVIEDIVIGLLRMAGRVDGKVSRLWLISSVVDHRDDEVGASEGTKNG